MIVGEVMGGDDTAGGLVFMNVRLGSDISSEGGW